MCGEAGLHSGRTSPAVDPCRHEEGERIGLCVCALAHWHHTCPVQSRAVRLCSTCAEVCSAWHVVLCWIGLARCVVTVPVCLQGL